MSGADDRRVISGIARMFRIGERRCSAAGMFAGLCLSVTGCSGAATVDERNEATPTTGAAAVDTAPRPAAAASAAATPAPAGAAAASRVIGKKDVMLNDGPVCRIDFVYGGNQPDTVMWEEPCATVTAKLVDRHELEASGHWDKLDSFDRKFVNALPGGRVLYVGGGFTASIYPIGSTLDTYEKSVAD